MTNGMDPDKMTEAERLDEVSQLLANGLRRLRSNRVKKRRFSRNNCLEVPLETVPHAIKT